jgi:hypothetical protein
MQSCTMMNEQGVESTEALVRPSARYSHQWSFRHCMVNSFDTSLGNSSDISANPYNTRLKKALITMYRMWRVVDPDTEKHLRSDTVNKV